MQHSSFCGISEQIYSHSENCKIEKSEKLDLRRTLEAKQLIMLLLIIQKYKHMHDYIYMNIYTFTKKILLFQDDYEMIFIKIIESKENK